LKDKRNKFGIGNIAAKSQKADISTTWKHIVGDRLKRKKVWGDAALLAIQNASKSGNSDKCL